MNLSQTHPIEPAGCSAAAQRLVSRSIAPTVCVLGCALQTENLGVDALGTAILKGIKLAFPNARIIMQDWSGQSQANIITKAGPIEYECLSLSVSNNKSHRNSTAHLRMVAPWFKRMPRRMASSMAGYNSTLKKLLGADIVLDVSAGDSFADIYGAGGFDGQAATKELAITLGIPLVLMPQTYGPFEQPESITRTRNILCQCALIASREEHGREDIIQLCGNDHPPIVRCPDVAFVLDPLPISDDREPFLVRRDANESLIGLNISGLLCNDKRDFGLAGSYAELITQVVQWAISHANTRVVFVPHVIDKKTRQRTNRYQECNDTSACADFYEKLSPIYGDRLGCLGGPYTASQTKYAVGQCDFFIGARMHSCIAGVSQAVPTATLAYSKKALGLMKQLGVPETVIDMRELGIRECIEQIDANYRNRRTIGEHLQIRLPQFIDHVERFFMKDLADVIERAAASSR